MNSGATHFPVLTLNGGSSTVKYAYFAPGESKQRSFSGQIDTSKNNAESAGAVLQKIAAQVDWKTAAVGHRIVHGGPNLLQPCRVTPEVVAELRRLIPVDPDHLPGEIALIDAITQHASSAPQVVCFDTAFHADMPRVAKMLPIPRRYEAAGIRRYGFHGLSYTFLMQELQRLDPAAAVGKVILAHLGSGASLAAVKDDQCRDTTMSFTPTAGLVMAARTGDLDPGVLIHLMRTENLSADQLNDLVNHQSGLLGVSETSGDMRQLQKSAMSDPRAADAVELFCYAARKQIAAMAAALDGVQTLVFSGGIGENSPSVRAAVCHHLGFLGVHLDDRANAAGHPIISRADSGCAVRVIKTDEESIIADQTRRVLYPNGSTQDKLKENNMATDKKSDAHR